MHVSRCLGVLVAIVSSGTVAAATLPSGLQRRHSRLV
jgi:hypothetical protein